MHGGREGGRKGGREEGRERKKWEEGGGEREYHTS